MRAPISLLLPYLMILEKGAAGTFSFKVSSEIECILSQLEGPSFSPYHLLLKGPGNGVKSLCLRAFRIATMSR